MLEDQSALGCCHLIWWSRSRRLNQSSATYNNVHSAVLVKSSWSSPNGLADWWWAPLPSLLHGISNQTFTTTLRYLAVNPLVWHQDMKIFIVTTASISCYIYCFLLLGIHAAYVLATMNNPSFYQGNEHDWEKDRRSSWVSVLIVFGHQNGWSIFLTFLSFQ